MDPEIAMGAPLIEQDGPGPNPFRTAAPIPQDAAATSPVHARWARMTDHTPSSVTFTLTEPAETPWLGIFFGYVAMVPFVVGVLAFALIGEPWRGAALAITLFWCCAILSFLSGVRRGVSFRTPGGVTAAQIATMLWLFCLAFAAIVLTALALPVWAAVFLLVGFLSLGVLDPIAARKLEAPLYFARLRPVQIAVPVLCLLVALVLLLSR